MPRSQLSVNYWAKVAAPRLGGEEEVPKKKSMENPAVISAIKAATIVGLFPIPSSGRWAYGPIGLLSPQLRLRRERQEIKRCFF